MSGLKDRNIPTNKSDFIGLFSPELRAQMYIKVQSINGNLLRKIAQQRGNLGIRHINSEEIAMEEAQAGTLGDGLSLSLYNALSRNAELLNLVPDMMKNPNWLEQSNLTEIQQAALAEAVTQGIIDFISFCILADNNNLKTIFEIIQRSNSPHPSFPATYEASKLGKLGGGKKEVIAVLLPQETTEKGSPEDQVIQWYNRLTTTLEEVEF